MRHAGEAVAVVVADDPYRLADALDRVIVAYEPLPVAATPAAAMAPSAPLVHDDWPDNVPYVSRSGTGDVGPGFASAHVIVEAHLRYPRVAGMPIETRGVLASEDRATGALLVWSSTQVPFAVRSAIAVGARAARGADPRPRARGGRRLRHQGPRVSRGDRGGGGGAAARPAGQVGGDPARALPERGGGSRPGSPRADRGGARRRHRRPRDGLHAGSRRVSAARRGHHAEHHQSLARAVSRAELSRRRDERRHPQDLRRRVSRRRAPRGRLRPRPAARPRGAGARHGPGGAQAPEHDPARRDALSLRAHLPRRRADHVRRGGLRDGLRSPDRAARVCGLARRAGEAQGDGAADRHRALRVRGGDGARSLRGRRRARRSRRHRLRPSRRLRPGAGPRDDLCPDLRRRPLRARGERGRQGRRHPARGVRHGHHREPRGRRGGPRGGALRRRGRGQGAAGGRGDARVRSEGHRARRRARARQGRSRQEPPPRRGGARRRQEPRAREDERPGPPAPAASSIPIRSRGPSASRASWSRWTSRPARSRCFATSPCTIAGGRSTR